MWKYSVVDLSDDSTTISNVGVIVGGVYINTTMSAHTCSINNGATAVFVIPASSTAGTTVTFGFDDGVLFGTSLIVDPDNSGTGSLTIMYKDQK